MLGLTCSKCGRRFTPSSEEIQTYLAQYENKRYALVLCGHCGYGNKVDLHRLQQFMRFTPAGAKTTDEPDCEASSETP